MTIQKKGLLSWMLLLFIAVSSRMALATESPDDLARNAFYQIEDKPFSRDAVGQALQDIKRAHETAPNDPWVLIAISRAYLQQGYLIGDTTRLSSYEAKAVENARTFAKRALDVGRQESMTYVQWARIQIITKDYRGACESLNQANKMDPEAFYPWYYRAVISLYKNDPARAEDELSEAERRAGKHYQKRWVVGRRIHLAKVRKDLKSEEAYYKAAIALEPQEPHPYGNYGNFLRRQKRYDEAIEFYEKALAIEPYPAAEEQLRKTRLLRDSSVR